MKTTVLLVMIISNGGHWFGGQPGTIEFRRAIQGALPAEEIVWELSAGPVRLGCGRVALDGQDQPTAVTITPPKVRVLTTLHLTWRLRQRDTEKELEMGEVPIRVYPAALAEDWAKIVGARTLVVCDKPEGLPKLLAEAKVPFTRIDDLSKQVAPVDLVLVGPGQLGDDPFSQAPITGLAEAGASIMIFQQTRPQRLLGYELAVAKAPRDLKHQVGHPLFEGLDDPALLRLAHEAAELLAVQLPPNEPALELIWWPRESSGNRPFPIDALALVKSMGKGRVVLWQIPLGDWSTDPRSQVLLGNTLAYLVTRPQPTPRPGERHGPSVPGPVTVPTITIPSGVKP